MKKPINEIETRVGVIKTQYYADGIACGVAILLNDEIVCMLDVMNEGTDIFDKIKDPARLIVYSGYDDGEPTHIIEINKEKEIKND